MGLPPADKEAIAAAKAHAMPREAVMARRSGDLPSRWVNHEYLPVVNQQQYGSCVSWATCYYMKGWQEAREHGWTHPNEASQLPSPAMPYEMLAADMGSGIHFYRALDFLVNHGTCKYDEYTESDIWEGSPQESAWRSAAYFRADSWSTFTTTPDDGFATLKTMLASGEPVVGVLDVTENIADYYGSAAISSSGVDNSVIFAQTGDLLAGHAVCFIGYDDNREYFDGTEIKHGAFLAVNSWGTWWGAECLERGSTGFFWMGYDLMATRPPVLDYNPLEFYTMVDRTGYQPSTFALLDFEHLRRVELGMVLVQGEWEDPDWSREAVMMGGSREIKCRAAIDLTDKFPTLPCALGLRITDYVIPYFDGLLVGQVNDFYLEDAAGHKLLSEGLPLVTRDMTENLYGDFISASILKSESSNFNVTARSAAASADIDGDGDEDLVINWQVYLNDGAGDFSPYGRPMARWTAIDGGEGCAFGDYNKDGRPDLAGAYYNEPADRMEIIVFANEGGGDFRELLDHIVIPNYESTSQVDWCDWNGDGQLDLATSTFVFLGNGRGYWKQWETPLPERPEYGCAPMDINGDGVLDWAWFERQADDSFVEWSFDEGADPIATVDSYTMRDFTGDGYPDLAIIGDYVYEDEYGGVKLLPDMRLYRNDGDRFTLVDKGFTCGRQAPRMQFADFNADGRLDLFAVGTQTVPSGVYTHWIPRVQFLEQRPDGTFQDSGQDFVGLGQGPLCIFDMNNDSDLDVFYGGSTIVDSDHPQFNYESATATNLCTDANGYNVTNTPPTTPETLDDLTGIGSMTLRWNAATDAETPAGSLRYRLRVGMQQGGNEVVSAGDERDLGTCLLPGGGHGYTITGQPSSYYFWSVQAIDDGGACSAWSPERLVIVENSTTGLLGDTNYDGKMDIADVRRCADMKNGAIGPEPATADLDMDGSVTEDDMFALAGTIIQGGGPLPDNAEIIGPEGGTISVDGFELAIPAGAFSKEALIRVTPGTLWDFGTLELPVVYSVTGIPATYSQPLDLWLEDTRTYYITPPLIVFGTEGYSRTMDSVEPSYSILSPDGEDDTWFHLTIEPPNDTKIGLPRSEDDWTFDFNAGVLGGYYAYITDHFNIAFPSSTQPELIENFGRYLENAYERFKQPDLGFSYSRRSKWPVSVCVKTGMGTTNGYQTNDIRGMNYGMLSFNVNVLSNDELARATAGHEFFHLVQSFYDPRNRFSAAWYAPPHLWLDEAASPWSEELFAGTPGVYVPDVTANDMKAPFPSLPPKEGLDSKEIAAHGYGTASVIRYLQNSSSYGGMDTVRKMYEKIYAGKKPIDALGGASTMPSFIWLDACYQAIIRGDVYNFETDALVAALAPSKKAYRIDSPDKNYWAVESKVAPLGCSMYRAYAVTGYAGFDPQDALVISLRAEKSTDFALMKYTSTTKPVTVDTRVVQEDPVYFEVSSAATTLAAGEVYLPLITSADDSDDAEEKPFRIAMGIAKEGTVDLGSWDVIGQFSGAYSSYVDFPTFSIDSASVDGGMLTELMRFTYDGGGGGGMLIQASTMWGPYPRNVHLSVPTIMSISSLQLNDSTLSASGPLYCEAILSWLDEDGADYELTYASNEDGTFDISIDSSMASAGIEIIAYYDVTETPKDTSRAPRTQRLWQPLLSTGFMVE